MSTTTITRCDWCGAVQTPSEREKWGQLVIGPLVNGVVKAPARDVCAVCVAKMRAPSTPVAGWKRSA